MFKKTKCYNCKQKAQYNSVAKICCVSGTALTAWIKYPKLRREEKSFASLQRRRKTRFESESI
ncbi:hypothetical protein GOY07_00540 [Wolbachia endosymbiont of Litomosoides sigmodontis]|uniref:hypothetical protein n=1 Tax=Wolbachia endosymbiont of Litomosoides sigmodontis TaxID=80850 RepID=UPI00158DA948|nr:hypothetical protein [Wolbachia endosymbiont of Litomosoides sigmodontis]QKX02736.1 hypothetical protein GOY07_00540 [Wolbachia endosymbiont of Litomosoides sigmodontis]